MSHSHIAAPLLTTVDCIFFFCYCVECILVSDYYDRSKILAPFTGVEKPFLLPQIVSQA
jgi:hypothetical protein